VADWHWKLVTDDLLDGLPPAALAAVHQVAEEYESGGAGGARTHDRQIMRKPARQSSLLAGGHYCASVLVRRDLPGPGGIGQDPVGWDGCSHSVPITRQGHGFASCAYLGISTRGQNINQRGSNSMT